MAKEDGNTSAESQLRMRYLETFERAIARMLCQEAAMELPYQVNPLGSVSRGTADRASDLDIEILFPNCSTPPLSSRTQKRIEAELNNMKPGFPVQLWVSVGRTGQCFDKVGNPDPELLDILRRGRFFEG